jgi:hypothetical protein
MCILRETHDEHGKQPVDLGLSYFQTNRQTHMMFRCWKKSHRTFGWKTTHNVVNWMPNPQWFIPCICWMVLNSIPLILNTPNTGAGKWIIDPTWSNTKAGFRRYISYWRCPYIGLAPYPTCWTWRLSSSQTLSHYQRVHPGIIIMGKSAGTP